MKLYAINAVAGKKPLMEGMMAVFTLPAEKRHNRAPRPLSSIPTIP